jgi:hypothetical protein
MGDYFKPWRRKIGAMTLVIACAFTAGWVRSTVINDQLFLRNAKQSHCWISSKGRLSWEIFIDAPITGSIFVESPAHWITLGIDELDNLLSIETMELAWNWGGVKLGFGDLKY